VRGYFARVAPGPVRSADDDNHIFYWLIRNVVIREVETLQ